MSFSFVKFSVLILTLQHVVYNIRATENSVNVTVLYESLCPGCQSFITQQLYDTYTSIGSKYINLEMIPHGFVYDIDVNGTMIKDCQHGPEECYGNRVHGCAWAHYPVDDVLGFVYCAERTSHPAANHTLQKCARRHHISWTKIEECLESGEAEEIFNKNGEITNAISPKYVPYIMFNGVFNETLEDASLTNFTSVICELLDDVPSAC